MAILALMLALAFALSSEALGPSHTRFSYRYRMATLNSAVGDTAAVWSDAYLKVSCADGLTQVPRYAEALLRADAATAAPRVRLTWHDPSILRSHSGILDQPPIGGGTVVFPAIDPGLLPGGDIPLPDAGGLRSSRERAARNVADVASPWRCAGADFSSTRLCITIEGLTGRGFGAAPAAPAGAPPPARQLLRFESADVVYVKANAGRRAIVVSASEYLSDVVEALFAQQEECARFLNTGVPGAPARIMQANQQLQGVRWDLRDMNAMRFTPATAFKARERVEKYASISAEVRDRMLAPYIESVLRRVAARERANARIGGRAFETKITVPATLTLGMPGDAAAGAVLASAAPAQPPGVPLVAVAGEARDVAHPPAHGAHAFFVMTQAYLRDYLDRVARAGTLGAADYKILVEPLDLSLDIVPVHRIRAGARSLPQRALNPAFQAGVSPRSEIFKPVFLSIMVRSGGGATRASEDFASYTNRQGLTSLSLPPSLFSPLLPRLSSSATATQREIRMSLTRSCKLRSLKRRVWRSIGRKTAREGSCEF